MLFHNGQSEFSQHSDRELILLGYGPTSAESSVSSLSWKEALQWLSFSQPFSPPSGGCFGAPPVLCEDRADSVAVGGSWCLFPCGLEPGTR